MATNVLIDTDVWIDHLAGQSQVVPGEGVGYSVVTRCELLSGQDIDEQRINQVLDAFTEYPVGRAEADLAGSLRRRKKMRTADALIAATALAHDLMLVTRNRRDFQHIAGLELQAPR